METYARIITESEIIQYKKDMKSVLKSILSGKIYAKINKVSSTGMTRYISFYRVHKNHIQNVTPQIAWIGGYAKIGEYKQGTNWLIDNGLKVGGCGMGMIFHTLYTCLSRKQQRVWNQRYSTL